MPFKGRLRLGNTCQFNCLKRTSFEAHRTITAALDIQIWGFTRVGLHDGAWFANFQSRTCCASLADVKIDADANETGHEVLPSIIESSRNVKDLPAICREEVFG
jgi:hypothetical protein